jgi:3-oxoacyl-[acyl-carrier protein] reductase
MSWGTLPGEQKVEGEMERARRQTPPGKRLLDLNVLVTGAGRGFGRLIALAMAQEGANVAVTYNKSAQGADETVAEIRKMGRKAMAFQADNANWEQVRTLADNVWSKFAPVDVLVNNSGDVAWGQMSWRDITKERVEQTLAVDVIGTLYVTHEFGTRMLERKMGNIVMVCSNVIVTGSPRAPQYAASKYGVAGLTKSYALAFAPWVRVNAVCPGYMDTEATTKRPDWTPQRRKWIVDHTPLRRIGKPEDIVPVVLFLASDDSMHMTGNFVFCDGGFSMPAA